MSVIFVDTETTGLDPEVHEVWEIALIEEDGTEHEWRIRPQRFQNADPAALRVTQFYERLAADGRFWSDMERPQENIAREIAYLTANKVLVGAVPWFDERFLRKFMSNDYPPAWDYHLVDVETLAAGKLGLRPPLAADHITKLLSIDTTGMVKHSALGDARWCRAVYQAVFSET